jgi:hypothetical protein
MFWRLRRLWLTLTHPHALDCPIEECAKCGERDCPHGAIEHYWHDGCPYCYYYNADGTPTGRTGPGQ